MLQGKMPIYATFESSLPAPLAGHLLYLCTRACSTLLALFVVMKIHNLLCGLVSRHRSVHASVLPRLTSLP